MGSERARFRSCGEHSDEDARQFLAANRLRQMIKRAEPHRLDRVRSSRMGSQHRDRRRMRSNPDAPQNLDPIHAGHAKVEQHRVDRVRIKQSDRLCA